MTIASTLVDRVHVTLRRAPEALRPYVGCFWVITAERGARLRIVPDGYATIGGEIRSDRSPRWFLRGPIGRPADRRFVSQTHLIGVRLRPGVPFLLSRISVENLVGRRLLLTNVPWARRLVTERAAVGTPEEHLGILETFLAERLIGSRVHPAVTTALETIQRTKGQLPMADVAEACHASPRHLTRLMRIWTGFSPKFFARIVRFQSTLENIDELAGEPLASLALANGYFDQAHLSGDVTRLAGTTPAHIASHSVADFSKTHCE